jgi:MoxR-like ATPase
MPQSSIIDVDILAKPYRGRIMGESIALLKSSMEHRIVGKGQLIDNVITVFLAGGHILLEDVPGVGKTSLAKALAESLSLSFARIQCTPDTTPSDITGVSIYNSQEQIFETVTGPVVNHIVLVDELNRTSPKTQSALLEVMEESKVTIDGKEIMVPQPFLVIGTQNPTDQAGTYPLPESQLDRFMIRLNVGYPDTDASVDMVSRFLQGSLHEQTVPVLSGDTIISLRQQVQEVSVKENLQKYAVAIVEKTRQDPQISCGASSRGLLSMLRFAQALAVMDERDYCIPEDIYKSASLTIPHRLILTPEARRNRVEKEALMTKILSQVSCYED